MRHPSIQVQGATATTNTASGGRDSEGSGEEANGGAVTLRDKGDKRSVSHCLLDLYNITTHVTISILHINACAILLAISYIQYAMSCIFFPY